ncbi:MAG TPA: SDR family oxidoreductase, partial [Burkholderiaceae bacterium]|nr:SDR family oxidoreductase [Burkholderiaceae bacterium]
PRLMILGCGDIGARIIRLLRGRFRIFAVTRQIDRIAELRAAGAIPIVADLDQPNSLARLARLASIVVHLAPPQSDGLTDKRTRSLINILPSGASLVYMSTTGVYGDCAGEMVEETRALNPQNPRAKRRVDAEQALRGWARRSGSRLSILRVPGIYGEERLPIERLKKGIPALLEQDDVYTNHIHADDLACIVVAALTRGAPGRVYHATDDSCLKMGEYFDAVAREFKLPMPPRLPRAELKSQVSPMLWSFMCESRRVDNQRIKSELGVRLRYPTVIGALSHLHSKDA